MCCVHLIKKNVQCTCGHCHPSRFEMRAGRRSEQSCDLWTSGHLLYSGIVKFFPVYRKSISENRFYLFIKSTLTSDYCMSMSWPHMAGHIFPNLYSNWQWTFTAILQASIVGIEISPMIYFSKQIQSNWFTACSMYATPHLTIACNWARSYLYCMKQLYHYHYNISLICQYHFVWWPRAIEDSMAPDTL